MDDRHLSTCTCRTPSKHSHRKPPFETRTPVISRTPVPFETRIPVRRRVPARQNYMAWAVGQDFKCSDPSCGCQDAVMRFPELAIESVTGLVKKLVHGYDNIEETPEELESLCLERVFEKIHLYDPERGAFTTWLWAVLSSVLRRRYNNGKKYKSRFVEENERFEDLASPSSSDTTIGTDIRETISSLISLHPEKRPIIEALFGGNPNEEDFCLCDRFNMAQASRQVGAKDTEVRKFVKDVVRPFFGERFGMTLKA